MEECVLIDQTALNEIIIPTTVIDRQLADGTRHKEETVNKSQIYIKIISVPIKEIYRCKSLEMLGSLSN